VFYAFQPLSRFHIPSILENAVLLSHVTKVIFSNDLPRANYSSKYAS